ncbi:MAG: hypothetical protein QOI04_71 [Verrucomicrobiota bacterium]|jgi:hypothetical protein
MSFCTPELLKALKASLVPLAQSCKSPPFVLALLNALRSDVPLSKEKDLPAPLFKPRVPAPV